MTGTHCPSFVHQSVVQLLLGVTSNAAAVVDELLVVAVEEADTTVTGGGGASAALRTPGTGTAVAGLGYDTMDEKGWADTCRLEHNNSRHSPTATPFSRL